MDRDVYFVCVGCIEWILKEQRLDSNHHREGSKQGDKRISYKNLLV